MFRYFFDYKICVNSNMKINNQLIQIKKGKIKYYHCPTNFVSCYFKKIKSKPQQNVLTQILDV